MPSRIAFRPDRASTTEPTRRPACAQGRSSHHACRGGCVGISSNAAATSPRVRSSPRVVVRQRRPFRADVPAGAVRAADAEGRGGAARARPAGRPARRRRAARGGPRALIVDRSLSANNPNNASQSAGDDLPRSVPRPRRDLRCRIDARTPHDPAQARNFRTPPLDLDSVYARCSFLSHSESGPELDRARRVRVPRRPPPLVQAMVSALCGECVVLAMTLHRAAPGLDKPGTASASPRGRLGRMSVASLVVGPALATGGSRRSRSGRLRGRQ
jgi:hypothetical protein